MGQKKLVRFAAIKTFDNVIQYPADMAGKWGDFFKNPQPLTLELACGKGEYAVGLGSMFPERNFLGVDIKGNRLYIGAKKALQIPLTNVGFMRAQIDGIETYFAPNEVQEVWITFPDPQLRKSRAKKRLTHPKFLKKYQQFLVPGGLINLKTDSQVLFRFTNEVINRCGCELLKCYDDVYQQGSEPELLQIKTHYEGLDIAGTGRIFYLQFRLPEGTIPAEETALKEWVLENEAGEE